MKYRYLPSGSKQGLKSSVIPSETGVAFPDSSEYNITRLRLFACGVE
jgi:hypothetical protein